MANKLRYLIVMPRFVQNVGDGYQFPLGVPYISASMKKAGYEVYTMNLNHIEGDIYNILKNEIEKNMINVVLIGGLSVHYNSIRSVVESAKSINPNIITIVGGGIITGDPEAAMMALEYADYGVVGEGEITDCELCYALENEKIIFEVDGLIYKNNDGSYVRTKSRKVIQDINSLPWPDYEGFEFEKSLQNAPDVGGMNNKRTVCMISSRSCPYNCTFCFHTTGNQYRERSLDDFFAELDYLISKYEIEYLCLEDELFSTNIERLKDFCNRIKSYKIKWWAQLRVNNITEEILLILKNSGCETISFGLESADNRVLKSMRKGITIEQIENALELVYKVGIHMQGNFIFGDIEETMETANNTINWWKEHLEYKLNFAMIITYPGSYLYKYACENGIIKDKVKHLRDGCPQVNVSKLTDIEFADLQKRLLEMSKSIPKTISEIKYDNIDYKIGRIDIEGECVNCKTKNKWNDIKLFMINFVGCSKCGQKYNVILPNELRENIDNNIIKLLKKYINIGMWCMNFHAYDLVRNSNIINNENVHLIDISQIVQKILISDKKVNSPSIISEKEIKAIIVLSPQHFIQIEEQIRHEYKCVTKVINIIELINPKYEI